MIRHEQVLQQTQKLSPQQIQVIRLLELPIVELEDKIRKELEENPTLEEGKEEIEAENQTDNKDENGDEIDMTGDGDLGDYMNEDDIPDYKLKASDYERETKQPEYSYSQSSTLHENLLDQLHLKELDMETQAICEYIIGNRDNNGYLNRDPLAIVDDIAFETGEDISLSMLEDALMIVQELDPAGVGARNLREALLLQLERKKATESASLAYRIIDEEFDAFSKRHYEKILKNLDITEEQLKGALNEIMILNPKPGNIFTDIFEDKMEQVIPDFIIENIDGELFVNLNNGNIPELRISNYYSDRLKDWTNGKNNKNSETKNALQFVKQKLDAARWFIDAVKQRNNTMLKVMEAIANIQKEFIITNDEKKLRPMILKDVAETSGYEISTVSRVSNSKYVMTDFGVFPLKYFYSESCKNDEGDRF